MTKSNNPEMLIYTFKDYEVSDKVLDDFVETTKCPHGVMGEYRTPEVNRFTTMRARFENYITIHINDVSHRILNARWGLTDSKDGPVYRQIFAEVEPLFGYTTIPETFSIRCLYKTKLLPEIDDINIEKTSRVNIVKIIDQIITFDGRIAI